ncbi:NAD(P)/FAD-dependent oxidoreductase [Aneurinibacillus sp. REN35]|uniref:NAD(P)/FAD-dependent oxidoreductase n=1 Tax=Aneurinibacillus sp. REN35 TaxID=3237286 RepID=UPI003529BC52
MDEVMDRLTLLSLDVEKIKGETADKIEQVYDALYHYVFSQLSSSSIRPNSRKIIVVGGGIIGVMAAFYLHQKGYQVTVLEKNSFGGAASGRNGGGILALGRELEEIPFVKVSMDLWEQLSDYGIDSHFIRPGHAMVAMNHAEAEKLGKAQVLYRRAGLDTTFLETDQVKKMLPDICPENKGALYSPIDAQSYPFLAIANLMKWLRFRGVTFYSQCEVKGFSVVQDRITSVSTNQGELAADTFLLCTGPWTQCTGRLLNLDLPIIPRRSQIMVTEILESRRMDPFVSGNGLYSRQTHAGNVLYGGGGPWEITGFDVTNSMEAMRLLSTRFVELFPAYRNRQLIRAFAGTVEITPDHFPIFGPVPAYHNLYVSGGFNGHGYGMSAVMGNLLAAMVYSDDHDLELPYSIKEIIHHFSPSRFSSPGEAEKGGEVNLYG